MRLIDADALEKEGWSLHRTIRVYQTKPLEKVPTITPEDKCCECDAWNKYKNYSQHWIPVTEELPKCSGWHIVTLQRNDCALVSYRWYSTGHGWQYGETPTAWMPLPEPYVERRTDGN